MKNLESLHMLHPQTSDCSLRSESQGTNGKCAHDLVTRTPHELTLCQDPPLTTQTSVRMMEVNVKEHIFAIRPSNHITDNSKLITED